MFCRKEVNCIVGNVVNEFHFGPLPVIREVLKVRPLLSEGLVSKFGPALPCDPVSLVNLDRALQEILCFPSSMCDFFLLASVETRMAVLWG